MELPPFCFFFGNINAGLAERPTYKKKDSTVGAAPRSDQDLAVCVLSVEVDRLSMVSWIRKSTTMEAGRLT